ncbi:hypothetical protein EJB05_39135, partial [Eragrostis curvula]
MAGAGIDPATPLTFSAKLDLALALMEDMFRRLDDQEARIAAVEAKRSPPPLPPTTTQPALPSAVEVEAPQPQAEIAMAEFSPSQPSSVVAQLSFGAMAVPTPKPVSTVGFVSVKGGDGDLPMDPIYPLKPPSNQMLQLPPYFPPSAKQPSPPSALLVSPPAQLPVSPDWFPYSPPQTPPPIHLSANRSRFPNQQPSPPSPVLNSQTPWPRFAATAFRMLLQRHHARGRAAPKEGWNVRGCRLGLMGRRSPLGLGS